MDAEGAPEAGQVSPDSIIRECAQNYEEGGSLDSTADSIICEAKLTEEPGEYVVLDGLVVVMLPMAEPLYLAEGIYVQVAEGVAQEAEQGVNLGQSVNMLADSYETKENTFLTGEPFTDTSLTGP